jgi:hypothetical protein
VAPRALALADEAVSDPVDTLICSGKLPVTMTATAKPARHSDERPAMIATFLAIPLPCGTPAIC